VALLPTSGLGGVQLELGLCPDVLTELQAVAVAVRLVAYLRTVAGLDLFSHLTVRRFVDTELLLVLDPISYDSLRVRPVLVLVTHLIAVGVHGLVQACPTIAGLLLHTVGRHSRRSGCAGSARRRDHRRDHQQQRQCEDQQCSAPHFGSPFLTPSSDLMRIKGTRSTP
jgi:hypothetical protein